jgi:hypothetical protein
MQLAGHHAGQRHGDHALGAAADPSNPIIFPYRTPSALDFRSKLPTGQPADVSTTGDEPDEAGRPPGRWYQCRRPDGGTEVVVASKRPSQRRLVTTGTITASVQQA